MAISRNLVGRESVARVQIPPSPPEKAPTEPRVRSGLFPFWRRGCFAKSRSPQGGVGETMPQASFRASHRLGATNSIAARRQCVHLLRQALAQHILCCAFCISCPSSISKIPPKKYRNKNAPTLLAAVHLLYFLCLFLAHWGQPLPQALFLIIACQLYPHALHIHHALW